MLAPKSLVKPIIPGVHKIAKQNGHVAEFAARLLTCV